VTPGESVRDAVHELHRAGIRFAITSGRPPRGMAMLVDPLAIDTPIAAFNGGTFVHPDLSVIEERELASDVARQAMEYHPETRPRRLGLLRR
jgi:hydroxymethylpyrimidine pyrophosphatase-like HAD family hydrolase